MALSVEIDKRSGFCGGAIRAISKAEEFLDAHPGKKLYSLGAIVHNEAELARLSAKGLVTISKEDIADIPDPTSETLLIRAHGEPPSTYALAREHGINLIDATCPVVLHLQERIKKEYDEKDPSKPFGPPSLKLPNCSAPNGQLPLKGETSSAVASGAGGRPLTFGTTSRPLNSQRCSLPSRAASISSMRSSM